MKKLFTFAALVIFMVNAAFANQNNTNAVKADSTTAVNKVKELSKKEYTIIANGDTIVVLSGDTSATVTFAAVDSVKFTGKTDEQMINGQKTKIKEITANGKNAWVRADQDLSKPIEMWCDEDESCDPISSIFIGLIALVALAGGWSVWRFVLRG